jgi:hypothetical protein
VLAATNARALEVIDLARLGRTRSMCRRTSARCSEGAFLSQAERLQSSSFTRVGSDRLAEWEQIMEEHVGLRVARFGEKAAASATLSATLPNDCIDDSDYESE